jgi:hypothetical protein
MKKYIYNPHHQGLILAPLVDIPDADDGKYWHQYDGSPDGDWYFDKEKYDGDIAAYNTWLSSPPAFKVREEDIKDFLEPIDESQFEVRDCETCGGDGKETCNNPDHGFIEAMPGDVGRIGCPVCGHDPKYKVPNGGNCEDCNGTGKVAIPKKGNKSKEQSPSVLSTDELLKRLEGVKYKAYGFPMVMLWRVVDDHHEQWSCKLRNEQKWKEARDCEGATPK